MPNKANPGWRFQFRCRGSRLLVPGGSGLSRPLCTMRAFFYIVGLLLLAACSSPRKPGDRTAEQLAIPTGKYPLAGFWKKNASDDWGMAIAPAGYGRYSVSFGDRYSDFTPGTYRPNSKIYGDKWYRVIDLDTIEMGDYNGNFDRYYRFESRTSTNRALSTDMTSPNK